VDRNIVGTVPCEPHPYIVINGDSELAKSDSNLISIMDAIWSYIYNRIDKIYILALFVLPILGLSLAYYLNRPDLAFRGIVLVLPIIAALCVLWGFTRRNISLISSTSSLMRFTDSTQKILLALYSVLFAFSVLAIAFTQYRPLVYFVATTLVAIIIFLQLFSGKVHPTVILLEIVLLSLNMIFGVTLKYPLYFGGTDILGHLSFAEVTYLSGHVIPSDLDLSYTYFPLFHIFISETAQIMGLSLSTAYFVITGLSYIVVIPLLYFLFEKILKDKRLSLLICLLYATTSIVIYYGPYMVTRTMAFVGFVMLLSLFYSREHYRGRGHPMAYGTILALVALFLTLVHQVSLPQILALLLLLLFFEYFTKNRAYLKTRELLLVSVLFMGYWLYAAWSFTEEVIKSRTVPKHFEEVIIKSSIQPENVAYFLQNNIDVAIFLFFALIGIGVVLKYQKKGYVATLALFSLASLALYVPNPLQTMWQTMTLFRFDRFMLFLSPFMAFIMGYGVYATLRYPFKKKSSTYLTLIVTLTLIGIFTLSSATNTLNAPDCADLWQNESTRFFGETDLVTFDFVENNVPNGGAIYSDYFVARYFSPRDYFQTADTLGLKYYSSNMIKTDFIDSYTGYVIFREGEYLKSKHLSFGSFSETDRFSYSPENYCQLLDSLNALNKVYVNRDNNLFWRL
jgi:hypothetical protein